MGYFQLRRKLYVEASISLEESVKITQSVSGLADGYTFAQSKTRFFHLSEWQYIYKLLWLALIYLGDSHSGCGNLELACTWYKDGLRVLKKIHPPDTELMSTGIVCCLWEQASVS